MNTSPLHIYLDQNKWIDLGRAFHDRPGGSRYKTVATKLSLAVREGKAVVPLSATHIIETRKRSNLSSRRRLSQVMSSISLGWTVAPNYVITPSELRVQLAKTFGCSLRDQPTVFGRGIPFACGMKTTLKDHGGKKVKIPRPIARKIDEYMSQAAVIEDFMCGGDQSINLLAVEEFRKGQSTIAETQEQFRAKAKSYGPAIHRRGKVANLTLSIQPTLALILAEFGKTMQDFLDLGKERLMAFFSEVPTLDVGTELEIARNEYWNRNIQPNDSSDITFLSVAIPHFDIVVTERFWCQVTQACNLDKKYNTVMLDDLASLEMCVV